MQERHCSAQPEPNSGIDAFLPAFEFFDEKVQASMQQSRCDKCQSSWTVEWVVVFWRLRRPIQMWDFLGFSVAQWVDKGLRPGAFEG